MDIHEEKDGQEKQTQQQAVPDEQPVQPEEIRDETVGTAEPETDEVSEIPEMPEVPETAEIPSAEETEEPSGEPSVEHISFEINTPAQALRNPVVQPVKKKRNVAVWIVAVVAVLALIANIAVMAKVAGAVNITGTRVNDDGELIVSYSDGHTENLGVVVGEDGRDGSDGKDGQNGINGTGSVSVMSTATNGLRSSVSIFCTFTQESRRGMTSQYYSAGSGVIYALDKEQGDALIITNYHVVYDADSRTDNGIAEEITVYLYGSELYGMEIPATYVGGSQYYDIAVLQVEGSELLKNSDALEVSIADSDLVQEGSAAIAIGNAEGEGISVSSGIVSVASEYITMTAADNQTSVSYRVMRIDTAVNSGNSGGGLFNEAGQLMGIVNAKIIDDSVEGIGYALPSAVVVAVADNIIDYCLGTDCESVQRPMLGVMVQTVESRAEYDGESGLLSIVETVQVVSAEADQIGHVLREGDVLVRSSLNGHTKELTRQYHLIDLLLTARVGDQLELTVLREGEEVTLTIDITEDCLSEY